MRECKIQPVPCKRINRGKICGKLPRIIHPAPDLYYAVCTCEGHNALFGRYQFLGTTPERAIQRWNDFHLHDITHNDELIEKIAQIMQYTEEEKDELKNKRVATSNKNSRSQVRPKHYSGNDTRKRRTCQSKRKFAQRHNVLNACRKNLQQL